MTPSGPTPIGHVPDPPEGAAGLPQVMQRVAGGDRGAFAHLYDEVAPMVHGTALRVLRDQELAAEVTQEVMVEVWRTAEQFDPARGSVHALVATMAHRRAVDRVRSVQARRTREEADGRHDTGRPYDDVVEEVERRADRQRVTRCLDALTELQREAVERAYYGGRSYREVAAELDVPLGTIKSRIRDGLGRLRGCLGVA